MSDPTFAVPDAVLDDLRARLQNTRWPSVVAGQGWGRLPFRASASPSRRPARVGDVGSSVAEQVARRHADRVTALHLTDVPWVTLYWVTNTIGSSFLRYVEYDPGADDKVAVPTGVTIFPKELVTAPREFADRFFNIVRWTELPKGGHFTAWEEPEAFAHELTALAQEVDTC